MQSEKLDCNLGRCFLFISLDAWGLLALHIRGLEVLALALLVTWVLADNHDATVATDDLALVANLLDAWVYLHVSYFFSGFFRTGLQQAALAAHRALGGAVCQ